MARKINKRKEETARLISENNTALYIRVSTEGQAEEGYSLAAQEERLRAFCTAQGWTVNADHIYIDAGISGKSTARPAYQDMMRAAAEGRIGRIVAIKLDRIARNTKDFLHTVDLLSKLGVDLILIKESFDTSTPHGKFALTMFAAIAELEASQITERMMSGKVQKASEGGYNGSQCPYGYEYIDGEFKPTADAQTVVDIFHTYVNDGGSMSGIAKGLNEGNVPTAKGGKWYAGTIRYILSNGFYAGLAQWDGQEVAGAHKGIISHSTYEAACKRLRNAKPGPRPRAARK